MEFGRGRMGAASSRIPKTSLALLWLLSSSEIFGCCHRIESTGAAGLHPQGIHQHHHHHHREVCTHVVVDLSGSGLPAACLSGGSLGCLSVTLRPSTPQQRWGEQNQSIDPPIYSINQSIDQSITNHRSTTHRTNARGPWHAGAGLMRQGAARRRRAFGSGRPTAARRRMPGKCCTGGAVSE